MDQWRTLVAVWLLGTVGLVVGGTLFFMATMEPAEALRWGLYWGGRTALVLSVFGACFVAIWLMTRSGGPSGSSGSGPMSPAG